jgi:WD40 repeat protein
MPPLVPEHELIRCVGAGSYGQVWLARSVLGSWRAVKVVHRRLFREDRPYDREYLGVQRFEPLSREDEGFVDILQTGRNDEGGYFYYVMELADDLRTSSGRWDGDPTAYESRTLSRVLAEQGRLPLEECVELGLALCRALGRLHEAGLIHRDVKPSNVIYVDGRPRLADIGLVVEQSEASSWVGTEGFIPPEGPNSPQADLYSLGKVLYVAMTGLDRSNFPRPPLGLGTGADGGRFLELNSIVLRACAAAMGARYATAAEMVSDLELLRSGGSVRQRRRRWSPGVRRAIWALVLFPLLGIVAWKGGWIGKSGTLRDRGNAVAGSQAATLTATGMRRLAEDDESAALVYFTEAFSAAASAGEATEIHRLRIGALRERLPRLATAFDAGGEVFSVDFSPDGRLVATADARGAATVWEVGTGRRVHGPHAPSGSPQKVRIAPDGRRLLLVPEAKLPAFQGYQRASGNLRILDLATGLPVIPEVGGVAWGVFSADGRFAATVGSSNQITLRSMEDPSATVELQGHTEPVSWMSFSPDGVTVASVAMDGVGRLWRRSDGAAMGQPLAIGGIGFQADFSPDGRRLSTLAMDPQHNLVVRGWDSATGLPGTDAAVVPNGFVALDTRVVGGKRLLIGNDKGTLTLRDAGGGTLGSVVLSPGKGKCSGWAVDPEGRRVAVGSDDGAVRVWDAADGRPVTSVLRHPGAVSRMALGPDGTRLLTVTANGLVRVWELGTAAGEMEVVELPGQLAPHDAPYLPYAFGQTAEGQRLFFSMARNGAVVPVCLDPRMGREEALPIQPMDPACVALIAGHREPVFAFHASGSTETNGVLVFRRTPGGWTRRVLLHPAPVDQMMFTDDDRHLLTLDTAQVVRKWELVGGTGVEDLPSAGKPVIEPSLSRDGRQLAWIDPGDGLLCVRELPALTTRKTRLPPVFDGSAYYQRTHFLSVLLDDAHAPGSAVGSAANLAFPSAAWAGFQITDHHLATERILVVNRAGSARIVNLGSRIEVPLTSESGNIPLTSVRFDPTGRFVVMVDQEGGVSVHAADSGDLVVPRVLHPEGVRWATLTSQGMLATGANPNRIRRWPLRPATDSPEKLRAQAEALAGRRIDDRGQLVWLAGSNLVQRLR